jgi:TolA-binding protein
MAAERFAQAEEVWKQFLTAFPNDAHAQQVRAQCAVSLSRQDRSEEALAMIDRWEKAGTSNLSEETRHAVLYEKAWCLRRLNRPETAEAFRAVLDATADAKLKAYALLELADLETKAGRLEPAKEYLNRLRGLSASAPQLVSAGLVEQGLYRLGRLEFQTQRYVESVEVLEEFLRMDPSSPQAVSAGFMAGDSYTKTGRLERAAEHFQTVVDRFPADPAGPAALLRLGEARAALHQWKLSETAFQTYLQRFEAGDARRQARFGLGFALENQRQFDDAVAAYQQVATASQDAIAARAQFQIGECLFAKEQYQQAAAELLKVDILYSHPDWSAAALYEAGRCFEKLGQVSDAHSQYRAVVEKFGQTKWAPLAAQALSQSAGG